MRGNKALPRYRIGALTKLGLGLYKAVISGWMQRAQHGNRIGDGVSLNA